MTHTFAKLEVSESAYKEIEYKLKEAGYDHTFIEGAIDMQGIALTKKKENTGRIVGVAEEKIEIGHYVSVDNITGKLRRTIADDIY
ncbi:MAG: hypothetical protein KJI69_05050 [Patescibacteria group bacterium]|nr:hypothetical protein [Patescibacteria group bacterium]